MAMSCSQVLSNLTQWQHPVIILKDVKYEDLSGIIEFIYHGEVSIDQECLPGFLQAAESLRIKGLTEDKKVNLCSCGSLNVQFFVLQDKIVDKGASDSSTPTKSTMIHKALKKLINGVPPQVTDDLEDVADNNNDEMVTESDVNTMVGLEEEEEALSEAEIPDGSLKGGDFQTMYHSFMSGSVSEDSEGSKEQLGVQEDGQALNFNFGDSNSPLKYVFH